MRIPGEKKAGIWATLLLAGCFLALLALPMASPLLASDRNPSPPQRALGDAPWSPNVRVDDDAGTAEQSFPSIAVDPRGNAYAVWQDFRPEWGIYFSYRPICGSWSASVRVDDGPETAWAKEWPSIAVDPAGNAYAVWLDDRTGDHQVYFSYRPAGGAWGANVKVSDTPGTCSTAGGPDIAVDSHGNAYAVWSGDYYGVPGIYFSYRPAGGTWGSSIRVNDSGHWPSIAVDPNGNAYLVWSERAPMGVDTCFSYRPAGGSWGGNVRVNDDAAETRRTAYRPDIAVDANGSAYAVWEDWRNGEPDLYFSYRPAGGAWDNNVRVNDDATEWANLYSSISVSPGGDAYAVWEDRRKGDVQPDIYFSYRPAGGSWGANGRVNDDTGGAFQGSVSVAVDPSGGAHATWRDDRNGNTDIYFSRLGTKVPALGDLVWHDTNWNGTQDAGEPGVQGIGVDLFATRDCAGTLVTSDVTDANGNYLFCVDPGTYCAEFSNISQGWTFTSQDQGADDALDSDANPATGRVSNIVVAEGEGTLDADVGLQAAEEFVPELSTLVLLCSGLLGLAGYAGLRLHK